MYLGVSLMVGPLSIAEGGEGISEETGEHPAGTAGAGQGHAAQPTGSDAMFGESQEEHRVRGVQVPVS